MERWGSSYLLQDVEAVRLIASLGSSTGRESAGSVTISFAQEPGVFVTSQSARERELLIKWDVALRLMGLLDILILQNRLLRDETPHPGVSSQSSHIFTVSGGLRATPIICSWDEANPHVQCRQVEGTAD